MASRPAPGEAPMPTAPAAAGYATPAPAPAAPRPAGGAAPNVARGVSSPPVATKRSPIAATASDAIERASRYSVRLVPELRVRASSSSRIVPVICNEVGLP